MSLQAVYCLLVFLCFGILHGISMQTGTVYFNSTTKTYSYTAGVMDKVNGAAYGSFDERLNETGWGVLNVAAGYSTAVKYPDEVVMTAAGMVEGILTQGQIYLHYLNMVGETSSHLSPKAMEKLKDFYSEQRLWMEMMINANNSTNWYYTGLIFAQFQGLMDGYAYASPPDQLLDVFAFDLLCGNGDYLDIRNSIEPNAKAERPYLGGHCSALIKVLPGYEDVFASHSSWYDYWAMNRIFKHYAFSLQDAKENAPPPATKVMTFSSYPGYLSSLDDFYIMDSGLLMLQTTNGIYNKTLYELVTPKALLAWHRVRLANWLASSGSQWAEYVAEYNSGTYNNQYVVLDLKKIKLKERIEDNALWIVEQIPGYVASGDQTPILREGYWPSYNVPFYEDVFNISGYSKRAENDTHYSYELCPRAKIFRRDQANVKDLQSMMKLMRSNDYKNDPYSGGNPMDAICSRGDLLSPQPIAGGCYDTKVTNFTSSLSLTSWGENGPTYESLPPFNWKTTAAKSLHLGQPTLYKFGFQKMSPSVP